MGRRSSRKSAKNPDRYIYQRDGNYHYKRRVPKGVAHWDDRSPIVRKSLGTDDISIARAKRDMLEEADDVLWASMLRELPADPARAQYEAAMRRVEALGYTYRTALQLAETSRIEDILSRLEAIGTDRTPLATAEALTGMIDAPEVTISEAFEIYRDEIVAAEIAGKSKFQRAQWEKVKLRAIANFKKLRGDKAMHQITREDAQAIYRHWLARIVPQDGKPPTHSPSSGNRDMGNLDVIYGAYFRHIGEDERKNPFTGLRFKERKGKSKRKRPPFPLPWLTNVIMKPGALAGMNNEARGIVLALIETGARPSELANIYEDAIILDHPVPHLIIQPRDDPDDPREIKTESSERRVPLVGIALEVFKKHPKGFPRYHDREHHLSSALLKFFKENGLFPTAKHKVYSFRHSFEDRMKDGGLDAELRKILMGHTIDRPDYGEGGSLEWRQRELLKIVLPFDPSII